MCLPSGFRRSLIAWVTAFMLASLVALALVGPMVWGVAADRPDPSAVLGAPPLPTLSEQTASAGTCSPGS